MSDLTEFRDHCRHLAESNHSGNCGRAERWTKHAFLGMPRTFSCESAEAHDQHEFIDAFGIRWDCPGLCLGCSTDEERAEWTRLANEVDAYLERDDEQEEGLFA